MHASPAVAKCERALHVGDRAAEAAIAWSTLVQLPSYWIPPFREVHVPGLSEQQGPLIKSTAIATVVQLIMVIAGHSMPAVAGEFAVIGTTISALAGLLFSLMARGTTTGTAAGGGVIAGGLSALIGIVVSHVLGDVPLATLAVGTGASGVAGIVGALIGQLATKKTAA